MNELVADLQVPSNRLIDVESLTESELETLIIFYKHLAELAKKEQSLSRSHSIEEAFEIHKKKYTGIHHRKIK